jgi:UDP-glucose 4-epimerase
MILVTGGAGYIGSHTSILLLNAGYEIVIIDNLCNSSTIALARIEEITGKIVQFVQADIRDETALDQVFKQYPIQAVIHFAGLKAVGESMQKPLEYFDNNIQGTIQLLKSMKKAGVHQMVFSSSATVYGENEMSEFVETMPTGTPTNNYGYTKLIIEQMLQKMSLADANWSFANLRYFNPIGAHHSGRIGEDPKGVPNNLMPYVAQVAIGKLPILNVYGNDYPTVDGTAVRDYIHVMDLAEGHLNALTYIEHKTGNFIWNLGTGNGRSVLEVIHSFEKITGKTLKYQFSPRRAGDIAACWANPNKAKAELGWQAKYDIEEMVRDLWHWQTKNPNGFNEA